MAIEQIYNEHLPFALCLFPVLGTHHSEKWRQKSLPSWSFHSSEFQFSILALWLLQIPPIIMTLDIPWRKAKRVPGWWFNKWRKAERCDTAGSKGNKGSESSFRTSFFKWGLKDGCLNTHWNHFKLLHLFPCFTCFSFLSWPGSSLLYQLQSNSSTPVHCRDWRQTKVIF